MYKSIFIIIVLTFCLGGCSNKEINNNTQNNETQTSKLSTEVNTNDNKNNVSENKTDEQKVEEKQPQEKEIAKFTTKIKTRDDNRNNNISITCSKLNGTIVEPGSIFSFCDTVGKATKSNGYEEAKTFKDGEVTYGIGGGNCQVSTTLYNAVLEVKNLKVTERHPHSADVPYIEEGKDAAVATGSYDFKFKNNTGKKIKIYATSSSKEVTITLKEISS